MMTLMILMKLIRILKLQVYKKCLKNGNYLIKSKTKEHLLIKKN